MEFDFWWLLLLPVAFVLGWLASIWSHRDSGASQQRMPQAYFKGLNFLLNEQPDRAIDTFVEVAKLDPETTDLHFALGALFRRRGETQRAIRVHQSLVERADLQTADRERALLEVAQDYLKAGLFDRSESAYQALLQTRFNKEAKAALICIYELERQWDKAIDLALQAHDQSSHTKLVHFYCEQALELAGDGSNTAATQRAMHALDAATQQSLNHPRPYLVRAQLQAPTDQRAAQQSLERAIQVAPSYAALAAKPYTQVLIEQGQATQAVQWLIEQIKTQPSIDLIELAATLLPQHMPAEQVRELLREAVQSTKSLVGLELVAKLAQSIEPERTELGLLQTVIAQHSDQLSRYLCSQCGFTARKFHWQCPGCTTWDTYQPKRAEELR